MKLFVIATVLVVVTTTLARPDNKYTTKYDNIDVDDIIRNDRLMLNYVNCLLEKGNCTPDGAELKRVLPDALKHECSKCSEKQKTNSKTIIRHLIDNKPDWWKTLEEKYDKDGEYRKKYKGTAEKEGVKL